MENKKINSRELPIELKDGLILRWADADDIETLAQFNKRIHSSDSENPTQWLGEWTQDLMRGSHPTTKASDFTVVVDQKQARIVSSLNLISQTWSFADIPIKVGRVELVGTDPQYRKGGLVRQQMHVIHDLSEEKGELVQVITGIPWYYRQFGYEMALNLGGGRHLFWNWAENKKDNSRHDYHIRRAQEKDISLLDNLYKTGIEKDLIRLRRDLSIWKFGLFEAQRDTPGALHCYIIEDKQRRGIGYAEIRQWGEGFTIRELNLREGETWRDAGLFLIQWLKNEAIKLNSEREKSITNIHFNLGETHPMYEALKDKLGKLKNPYAWFIRVPDLPHFLTLVAPVLENRLFGSIFAGYSGSLRLSFFKKALVFTFENGALATIKVYTPKNWDDADVFFPGLTFLQLLFGYRSFKELDFAFADCYAMNEKSSLLVNALFPRCPSHIDGLN